MTPIRRPAVVHEVPETNETVVCHVDGGTLLVLNDVGAAVWHLVDGRRTVDDIAAFVASTVGVAEDVAQRDVQAFVETLRERGVVDVVP
jgi:hypothetical protein